MEQTCPTKAAVLVPTFEILEWIVEKLRTNIKNQKISDINWRLSPSLDIRIITLRDYISETTEMKV